MKVDFEGYFEVKLIWKSSREIKVFNLWTWLWKIQVDFLCTTGNSDTTKTWPYLFMKLSQRQLLSPWGKTVHISNIHSCSLLTFLMYQEGYEQFSHYYHVFSHLDCIWSIFTYSFMETIRQYLTKASFLMVIEKDLNLSFIF